MTGLNEEYVIEYKGANSKGNDKWIECDVTTLMGIDKYMSDNYDCWYTNRRSNKGGLHYIYYYKDRNGQIYRAKFNRYLINK